MGSNFKVNDDQGNTNQHSSSVSIDGNGNFTITWRESRNGNSDIYAQRFAIDGSADGGNFKVNDSQGDVDHFSLSISSDNDGNFVITWAERHDEDLDIYGQRYAAGGSAVDSNFRVTNISEKEQRKPAVALFNGRIYNAWTDNRAGGTVNDIWANVLVWGNPTGITDKENAQIPSAFVLHQNYPNPFNPTTTISYDLPQQSNVELAIYNMAGQNVAKLVSEQQTAGSYQYEWHAGDLASGVYIYQLKTDTFTASHKLLLLK